jgi:Brp/Blh family beta-carotene 15,15'-monooxygenase
MIEITQKKGLAFQPAWDNWLLLGWGLLSVVHAFIPLNDNVQLALFLISILLTGIPHGALDHLVEEKNSTLQEKNFSMLRFLAQYFVRMAVFAILWYFVPLTSLGIFLVLSAYHFGETDLAKLPFRGTAQKLLQLFYGLMILSFILLTHLNEVIPVINQLPPIRNNSYLFYALENRLTILTMITAITMAIGIWLYKKDDRKDRPMYLGFGLQLIGILWIMVSLPLILAFTFYFGCWHSLHALNNIRHHLSELPQQPLHWRTMMRRSLPFSLAACLIILLLVLWASSTYDAPVMLMGFFIGIAILTAPHLEIMSKMQQHLK